MAAVAVAGPEPEEPGGSFRRYLARLGALRSQPGAERPDGGRRTELHLLFDQLISESCRPAPAAAPSPQVRPGSGAGEGSHTAGDVRARGGAGRRRLHVGVHVTGVCTSRV